MNQQSSLFPILIKDIEPAGTRTQKLKHIGISETGVKYALKTLDDDVVLPITEWFCYSLCRLTGIATPDFDIVKLPDGSLAFGSKWQPPTTYIIEPDEVDKTELLLRLANVQDGFSQMMALDLFLPNHDRHFGNMMFDTHGNNVRLLAFDWSHVYCLANQFIPDTLANNGNTLKTLQALKQLSVHFKKHFLDDKKTLQFINRVKALHSSDIEKILVNTPEEWQKHIDISAIISWWNLQNISQRLTNQVEKHL